MRKLYLVGLVSGVLLATCGTPVSPAFAGDSAGFGGTFSDGYRMGQLSKFSVKGLMMKSGEGQLLLGRESTPYQVTYKCGESTCKKTINPWYFSADPSQASQINPHAGEYVVIHYNQARIKSPAYDTDYMVADISPVTREFNLTCVDKAASGSKSKGFRIGRIVKASRKGQISKTYEIMIQVGNAGNQFKHMSIESPETYECAVEALKSAKKVKIHYKEAYLHNPFGQDTGYNVLKIEPLSDI